MTIKDLLEIQEHLHILEKYYYNECIKYKSDNELMYNYRRMDMHDVNILQSKIDVFVDKLLNKGVTQNDNIE